MDADGELDGELIDKSSPKKDSIDSNAIPGNNPLIVGAPKQPFPAKSGNNPVKGEAPKQSLPSAILGNTGPERIQSSTQFKEEQKKPDQEKVQPPNLKAAASPPLLPVPKVQENIIETKGQEKLPQHAVPSSDKNPSNPVNSRPIFQPPVPHSVQRNPHKDPQKAVLKFARFLSSCINPIQYKTERSNETLNNLPPGSLPKLRCPKCDNFFVGLPLTCSHSTCLICFQTSLQKFISDPTPKTFQKFSCPECSVNCCKADVEKVYSLKENNLMRYEALNSRKVCMLCGINGCLHTDFFGELECLHLCRNCYAEDLMFGGTNCPCCSMIYKNKEATKNRTAKCMKCHYEGKFVTDVMRDCHNNHVLCFSCLEDSVIAKKCVYCRFDLSGSLKVLKAMLMKKCCLCKKPTSIADLFTRPCCSFFQCLDCTGEPAKCKTCNIAET